MNTQTCRATNSDPAFVSSSFGNAEDQAICKPVRVAQNAAGFDARVAALFRPYYATTEDWLPISLGAYFGLNLPSNIGGFHGNAAS